MPDAHLRAEIARGLERSCVGAGRERILAAPASPGLERIEAHLTRHFKKAFGMAPGRWAALTADGRRLS
jgi:hypothetical protein